MVKITPASKSLQIKAGKGDIPPPIVEHAEETLKNNNEDFQSIAIGFLDRLEKAVARARNNEDMKDELIDGMTKPVMELKANARMLKYDLVTSLANIMLDFLETIEDLDRNAVEIVAAHHRTLTLIIAKQMKGDGGAVGITLQKELQSAVQRYFTQKKQPIDT